MEYKYEAEFNGNTQIKYSEFVLQYSTRGNALSYIPPMCTSVS